MAYYLPGIFSLLVAASGWFYLFYSRAATRLQGIEEQSFNRRRVKIRRVGGIAMVLLGVAFFAGSYTFDAATQSTPFIVAWLLVLLLLMVLTVSALLDLRITMQLRKRSQKPPAD